jgi:hypothetical protein
LSLQLDQLGLEFDNGMRDDAGCQGRPPVRGARSWGGATTAPDNDDRCVPSPSLIPIRECSHATCA